MRRGLSTSYATNSSSLAASTTVAGPKPEISQLSCCYRINFTKRIVASLPNCKKKICQLRLSLLLRRKRTVLEMGTITCMLRIRTANLVWNRNPMERLERKARALERSHNTRAVLFWNLARSCTIVICCSWISILRTHPSCLARKRAHKVGMQTNFDKEQSF